MIVYPQLKANAALEPKTRLSSLPARKRLPDAAAGQEWLPEVPVAHIAGRVYPDTLRQRVRARAALVNSAGLMNSADVLYKTTDCYAPEHERRAAWNDPSIGIQWSIEYMSQLSAKDRAGQPLANAEVFD